MIRRTKSGMLLSLFRERQWPDVLQNTSYSINNEKIDLDNHNLFPAEESDVLSLRLIPDYIRYSIDTQRYNKVIVSQINWGYAIDLSLFENSNDYLKNHFSSSTRKVIRRYIRRLEHSLEVSYQLHYGSMDKNHYDFLMRSLQKMIIKRFEEKGDVHKEIHLWKNIEQKTYHQVINKEASLFVIYHNKHPIQISLNYHLDKILFSSISSYDINYAKFGLGHVEICKQLEWCCKNGYLRYEMGVGGTTYKKRWSNTIYNFQHHIIYPKRLGFMQMMAFVEIIRIKSKEFLKRLKVNEIPNLIRYRFLRKKVLFNGWNDYSIASIDGLLEGDLDNLKPVHFEDLPDEDIKRMIFNFLYSSGERYDKLKILENIPDTSYMILGESQCLKLERRQ